MYNKKLVHCWTGSLPKTANLTRPLTHRPRSSSSPRTAGRGRGSPPVPSHARPVSHPPAAEALQASVLGGSDPLVLLASPSVSPWSESREQKCPSLFQHVAFPLNVPEFASCSSQVPADLGRPKATAPQDYGFRFQSSDLLILLTSYIPSVLSACLLATRAMCGLPAIERAGMPLRVDSNAKSLQVWDLSHIGP